MKRVFIIAGETSGDLHGAALMNRMKARLPDCAFDGIGGPRMIGEGLDAIRRVRDMNFMGFVEVVRHLPFIRRTMRECVARLDGSRPDLVVLIDYPGFNLRLAPLVRKRGIPLMYFISPQLWAWHRSRVKLIRATVDRMVVLFDFERDFYRRYGVEADFVGHPLIDVVKPTVDRATFRASLGASGDIPVVGFLPGSRMQEIERILPAMAGSVDALRASYGDVLPVLGCAPEIDDGVYRRFIGGTGIVALRERTYDIMAHADALAVTSGTATLESGISGAPMVIVYRTSPVTYHIGKLLVRIPNIGLINIVAGKRIVPELWQNEVTPENIAGSLASFLTDTELRERTVDELRAAKERLGEPGAADRAAAIALDMLGS